MLSFPYTRALSLSCLLAVLGSFSSAHAALTLNATRLIYESDKRSTSIIVANPSERTYAAQAWVNTRADDTTTAVPFTASPTLFRLDPGKERTVQIANLPNDLPVDRESLFFFNLQEIPQTVPGQRNALNIALRTRIKLFYRPSQLSGPVTEHLKDLRFSLTTVEGKAHLHVHNPSPFHFTFSRLDLEAAGRQQAVPGVDMIAPMSEQTYPMPSGLPAHGLQAVFSVITDYGNNSAPMTLPVHGTP